MWWNSANMTYKQLSMTVEFSLMVHKKRQVLFCWLKNGNFNLAGHALRGSASDSKKDAGHTLWEAFLGAATCLFVLDCLCFTDAISGFNFWETASLVIGVKPKMASFLTSFFCSKCGAQACCFLHMWQVIPTWLGL